MTVTDHRALDAIHEAGSHSGSFKDRHPWHVAKERFDAARANQQQVAVIFVVEPELKLQDWALIEDIDVATYSGQKYETRCTFKQLRPVTTIFEDLGSLVLLPSSEQLHREKLEPIRQYRNHLDQVHLYPYAICETPAFMFRTDDDSAERNVPQ